MPFSTSKRNVSMCKIVREGLWLINEPVTYTWMNDMVRVHVPAGFKTDLASVPWCFEWYVNNSDKRIRRPAIIHDYCYRSLGCLRHIVLTRKQCDDMFLDALKEEGVGRIKRTLMWLGVRSMGWLAWKN